MLSPGSRLGAYEILTLIGSGGMGEVYKARDTRLNRTVAIKILPPALAADSQFRERFDREARIISQLDHPHICTLYDVGTEDGSAYLVMQYLEGETLAERLTKGALPLDQALPIAIDVAAALDKAHHAGIIHRDLKPANIMLTKTGAKLLDFGVAKLRGPAIPIGLSTMTFLGSQGPETAQGMLMGTINYMSPEQLEGRETDARCDIFAFGAVVYEMVTGCRAFDGNNAASVIGAILKDEPLAITVLQPRVPVTLDHAIRLCLARDADERWQSIGDLKRQLMWILQTGSQGTATVLPLPARSLRSSLRKVFIIILVLLGSALVLAVYRMSEGVPQRTVVRFSVYPPPNTSFIAGNGSVPSTQLAISPDGRRLAFIASVAGRRPSLWIRSLDELAARSVPGTDDASYPFWSPDSHWVAFFARGKLSKIEISGGTARTVCAAGAGRGGSWNADDIVLFAAVSGEGLYRVPAAGGTPRQVTTLNRGRQETSHRFPYFLPDGRRFLFFVRSQKPENGGIYLGSLDSTDTKQLVSTNGRGLHDSAGFTLFPKEGVLMAQAFEPRHLNVVGDPFEVASHVGSSSVDYAAFSVSNNGVLAYASGNPQDGQLTWFDRTGQVLGTIGDVGDYVTFSISPNQDRVAYSLADPKRSTSDIWVRDLVRGNDSRFTLNPATDASPVWSPDGARIVFRSDRRGNNDLYIQASSGTNAELLLVAPTIISVPTDWSADGRYIVYHTVGVTTGYDLWVLPLSGDRKPRPFLQTPFNEMQGHLSPNGRWMAYTSDESGTLQVYVRPFPSGDGKWQVSTIGGSEPMWRHDGKELLYLAADRKLMAVPIASGPAFNASAPRPLFETHVGPINPEFRNQYAVTSDGNRFLVNTVSEGASSSPITIVLNWTEALKK